MSAGRHDDRLEDPMTPEQRPVVVGVDGSPEALAAARLGAREAAARHVPLEIVLALPWLELPQRRATDDVDLGGVARSLARLLLAAAKDAAAHVAPAVPVLTRTADGRPADVLVAESQRAALLCIGSRGGGLVGDLFLGSVAAAVTRLAGCPVLVVPAHPLAAVSGRAGVVVGVDGGPGDDRLLDVAFAAAAARGTGLTVVHAWRHTVPGPAHLALDPLVGPDAAQHREDALLDDLLDGRPERWPGVPVRRLVERARPAATLVAAGLPAELLVVGHRPRRNRLTGALGSVAGAVLHRAPCPVLVVPLGAATAPAAA
jgi:nucleotide-binding universal stress UspA family protein